MYLLPYVRMLHKFDRNKSSFVFLSVQNEIENVDKFGVMFGKFTSIVINYLSLDTIQVRYTTNYRITKNIGKY